MPNEPDRVGSPLPADRPPDGWGAHGVTRPAAAPFPFVIRHSSFAIRRAFTLIEVMVVMALLSLIVIALMAVFNSTQAAFRASSTQADVLGGGSAAMDLITADLRQMTPSLGQTNTVVSGIYVPGAVNFFATNNSVYYQPLSQTLPGSTAQRTNLLQWFFVLGRQNANWTGAGYIVNSGSTNSLYPLYRFYAQTNVAGNPLTLFYAFETQIFNGQWTNLSHVLDGVVHLTLRAYDTNGVWLTNSYGLGRPLTVRNTWFSPPQWGEVGFTFFSNSVPASVEVQLGVLEDRAIARAASLGIAGYSPSPSAPTTAQWQYLQNQAGRVHLFRQRVNIPNVDPSAYQ